MHSGNEIMVINLGENGLRFPWVEAAGFGMETRTDFPVEVGQAPKILLLDCGVDPPRGLKLLDRAKTVWPHVPVIFITEISSEEIIIRAWKGGAWEFFRHPLQKNDLEESVKFLLEVTGSASPTHLSPIPDPLQRSLKFIQQNLTRSITLSDLASTASLSPYHFSRKFRQAFGLPPMAYVRKERVARAEVFLCETSLPVSQIAYRVGFNDYSDFIKQFKKVTGESPTKYRTAAKLSNFSNGNSKARLESDPEPRTLISSDDGEPKNKRLRRRTVTSG